MEFMAQIKKNNHLNILYDQNIATEKSFNKFY